MALRSNCGGIDDSLLFFFLLLVMIFCQGGVCGYDQGRCC